MTWWSRRSRIRGRWAALALAGVTIVVAGRWATPARASSTTATTTWFAPYVDSTLTPVDPVATRTDNPASQTAFGFVVSKTSTDCVPSWGTYYSLTAADQAPLDLSTVFRQMEHEGEVPIVSFGGEANTPLADACETTASLEAAYLSVLDHYNLLGKQAIFDFDIEGAAQGNTAALVRQAAAIAQLQAATSASGGQLGVWLTLPVTTQGLLPVAENVVKTMLAGGVQLSGVNVMTMYFGQSPGDGAPMLTAVENALKATHSQLAGIFAAAGLSLTPTQVWEHEGATVQIGDAGVPNQAFTVADAQGLESFAQSVGLGRVSMWSINQDQPCPGGSTGGYSNYCSNVAQTPLAFDNTFALLNGSAASTPLLPQAKPGSTGTRSSTATTTTSSTVTSTTSSTATSSKSGSGSGTGSRRGSTPRSHGPKPSTLSRSYPAWSARADYPRGFMVLHGTRVFRARWWNHDVRPIANIANTWNTPWEVLGSVAAGTKPWTPHRLPAGTYPTWSAKRVYTPGMKVLFHGLPYKAKWWTKGAIPSSTCSGAAGSPWLALWHAPGEPGAC